MLGLERGPHRGSYALLGISTSPRYAGDVGIGLLLTAEAKRNTPG